MIQISEPALAQLKKQTQSQPGIRGIRLGVKNAGCNGFAYTLELATQCDETDEVFEREGVKIIVSKAHLPTLSGTTLDYVVEGLNASFKFLNPNAKSECGCGESFSVEK